MKFNYNAHTYILIKPLSKSVNLKLISRFNFTVRAKLFGWMRTYVLAKRTAARPSTIRLCVRLVTLRYACWRSTVLWASKASNQKRRPPPPQAVNSKLKTKLPAEVQVLIKTAPHPAPHITMLLVLLLGPAHP